MKDVEWSNVLIWIAVVVYYFNGFDYVFTSEKKEDKTVISVEQKREKKEDKDIIKSDW